MFLGPRIWILQSTNKTIGKILDFNCFVASSLKAAVNLSSVSNKQKNLMKKLRHLPDKKSRSGFISKCHKSGTLN